MPFYTKDLTSTVYSIWRDRQMVLEVMPRRCQEITIFRPEKDCLYFFFSHPPSWHSCKVCHRNQNFSPLIQAIESTKGHYLTCLCRKQVIRPYVSTVFSHQQQGGRWREAEMSICKQAWLRFPPAQFITCKSVHFGNPQILNTFYYLLKLSIKLNILFGFMVFISPYFFIA